MPVVEAMFAGLLIAKVVGGPTKLWAAKKLVAHFTKERIEMEIDGETVSIVSDIGGEPALWEIDGIRFALSRAEKEILLRAINTEVLLDAGLQPTEHAQRVLAKLARKRLAEIASSPRRRV